MIKSLLDRKMENLFYNNVSFPQTGLVQALLKQGGISLEDIENFDNLCERLDGVADSNLILWFWVTPWLGKKLARLGAVVINHPYGNWWGTLSEELPLVRNALLRTLCKHPHKKGWGKVMVRMNLERKVKVQYFRTELMNQTALINALLERLCCLNS